MNTLFQSVVLSRLWLTFAVLGLSFLVGAPGTLNLANLLTANLWLVRDCGLLALMDGARQQRVELTLQGVMSCMACVVFKTCEHRLSELMRRTPGGTDTRQCKTVR